MKRRTLNPDAGEDFSNVQSKDCVSCNGYYEQKEYSRCRTCRSIIHRQKCNINFVCMPCCKRDGSASKIAQVLQYFVNVKKRVLEERPTGPTITARCEKSRGRDYYDHHDSDVDDDDDDDENNGFGGSKNYNQYCQEYDASKKYYIYIPPQDDDDQEDNEDDKDQFFMKDNGVISAKCSKRSTIKDLSMKEGGELSVLYNKTRLNTFEKMWDDIQALIGNLLSSLHSKVTDPIGLFISRNYPSITLERLEQTIKGVPGSHSCTMIDPSLSPFLLLDTLDPLPAIILHNTATTGEISSLLQSIQGNVMTRLQSRSLYQLYEMEVFRPPFVVLQPNFCKNFKEAISAMCQKFMASSTMGTTSAQSRTNTAHNIEQLKHWYNQTYTMPLVRQTARRYRERHQTLAGIQEARVYQTPAIVYLEDFEKWDTSTLTDLINALNIYRRFIPFVLVFGIRTSKSIIQDRFSFDQISTLRFKSFHLPSQIENFDHLTKIIYQTNQRLLFIGPKLYNYLYHQFIDHHLSVTNFTNTLKFALAEHFFYTSRLSFLAIPQQIKLFRNQEFNNDSFRSSTDKDYSEEDGENGEWISKDDNMENNSDSKSICQLNSSQQESDSDIHIKTEEDGTDGNGNYKALRPPRKASYSKQAFLPSDSEDSISSSSNQEGEDDDQEKDKEQEQEQDKKQSKSNSMAIVSNRPHHHQHHEPISRRDKEELNKSMPYKDPFTVCLPIEYIKSLGSVKKLLKLEPGLDITIKKIQQWIQDAQIFMCVHKTVLDCYLILLNSLVSIFKKENIKYYQMMVDISTTKNNNLFNQLKTSILLCKESDIPTLVSVLLSCKELLLLCTSYESDVALEMVTQHIPQEIVLLVDELSKTIKYLKQIETNTLKMDDFEFILKPTSSTTSSSSASNQKGWSLQKKKEYELMKGATKVKPPLERLLNHFVDKFILPISFDYIYKPIESIPLSEIFNINSTEGLERRFNTRYTYDFKIQKTNPNEFLKCQCCKSGTNVSKYSEDIQIAFKTYLECGKFINLFDWLNSFCSYHESGIVDELRAKFSLCVDSIKFQGYIEKTKKRVDHVEKMHV
ncbi:hypothetical protein CYY_005657 [Polysphondylium violaceum]|uniref:Origin recognition complex subunit 3 n=1 Tax=Polysphondylium violaceum TaxID=133409 RepID=A0A8J4PTG8_9MYCE|nr:hypothetical protein CYY_005657 [Polysphondylium violaceum]